MKKTIYYSKMNATPDPIVQKELGHLQNTPGISISMHLGGQYREEKLQNADIVMVTSYNKARKGMGVGREVETALSLHKPCYVFYSMEIATKYATVKRITDVEFDQEGDVYLNRYILKLGKEVLPLASILHEENNTNPSHDSNDMDDL